VPSIWRTLILFSVDGRFVPFLTNSLLSSLILYRYLLYLYSMYVLFQSCEILVIEVGDWDEGKIGHKRLAVWISSLFKGRLIGFPNIFKLGMSHYSHFLALLSRKTQAVIARLVNFALSCSSLSKRWRRRIEKISTLFGETIWRHFDCRDADDVLIGASSSLLVVVATVVFEG